ncbi:MAG TPA: glycosyltransferase family 4 protein [Solirubrobacteraceae bacterium]|nr:glycosyltransferase family 4 protein [Solirubrobacteraceae bacterium]
MSDLLITAITPTIASGTGLRTYGVAAALARHHPIEVAYVVWGAPTPAPEYEQLGNVRLRALRTSRGVRRGLAYAGARARQVPRDLARGVSTPLLAAARSAPGDVRVIADGPVAAAALLPLARRRELVYLAHNLESSGFRPDDERTGLERFERNVLRTFAECWMATRADERGATALAGEDAMTRYVPNVLDTDRVQPTAPARTGRLLFVGDFTYRPNLEALAVLDSHVLPAIWKTRPEVRLTAIGRGLPEGRRDDRIETPGFVEDLTGAYRNTAIVLVPLERGGGSPLKFIEGLAYGLPVVASTHAAALIEDGQPGRDFLAADNPAEFAAAIFELLDDPDRALALGAAGRQLAMTRYSVDALATLLGS